MPKYVTESARLAHKATSRMKEALKKRNKRAAASDMKSTKKKTKTHRTDSPTAMLGNESENSSIDTTTLNEHSPPKPHSVRVETNPSFQELQGLSRSVEKQSKRKPTSENGFPPEKTSKVTRTSAPLDDETSTGSTAQMVDRFKSLGPGTHVQSRKQETISSKKGQESVSASKEELDLGGDWLDDSTQYYPEENQASSEKVSFDFAEALHGGIIDPDGDEDDFWFTWSDACNVAISIVLLCLLFAIALRWMGEHEQYLSGKFAEGDGEMPLELTGLLYNGKKLEPLKFH